MNNLKLITTTSTTKFTIVSVRFMEHFRSNPLLRGWSWKPILIETVLSLSTNSKMPSKELMSRRKCQSDFSAKQKNDLSMISQMLKREC